MPSLSKNKKSTILNKGFGKYLPINITILNNLSRAEISLGFVTYGSQIIIFWEIFLSISHGDIHERRLHGRGSESLGLNEGDVRQASLKQKR